jgi:hypothetical protein
MYFAQGIPQGLLSIAIPVWLASQGVGAGDIGSYLDAGELKDLSSMAISDFFKSLAAPERK